MITMMIQIKVKGLFQPAHPSVFACPPNHSRSAQQRTAFTMQKPARPPSEEFALFTDGFRPLFEAAGLFAVLVMPHWMLV